MALMHTMRYLRQTEDEHMIKEQPYCYLFSMVGLLCITGGFHRPFSSTKHVFIMMATFDKVNHVIYWMILMSIAI